MTKNVSLKEIIDFASKIIDTNGNLLLYRPANEAFHDRLCLLPYYEIRKLDEQYQAQLRYTSFQSRETVIYDDIPKGITRVWTVLDPLLLKILEQGYTVPDFMSALLMLEMGLCIEPVLLFTSYVEFLMDHAEQTHFYSGCVVLMIHLTKCLNEYQVSGTELSLSTFLDISGSTVDSKEKEFEWIEQMSNMVVMNMNMNMNMSSEGNIYI